MAVRASVWRALEPSAREGGRLGPLNWFIIILVLASFAILAIETELSAQARLIAEGDAEAGFAPWPAWLQRVCDAANMAILATFAVEFGVRLWACGADPRFGGFHGPVRYFLQPLTVTDFLAFAPELIVTLLAPQAAAGTLAALRMLRLLRLFKLMRYAPALDILVNAFNRARPQLLVTLMFAAALLFVSAALLHFIEGSTRPQEFGSIPRALWWSAVTLTTIGYGDVFPITPLGKFAAAVTALAGIAFVALPTGIFASAISDELKDRHEAQANRQREMGGHQKGAHQTGAQDQGAQDQGGQD